MNVEHDLAKHRFIVRLPEGEGELVYSKIAPHTLDLLHTGVQPSLRGRGVSEALVRTAFDYARQNRLRVVPTCPYVQHWLTSHPEENDLVVTRADAS